MQFVCMKITVFVARMLLPVISANLYFLAQKVDGAGLTQKNMSLMS